MMGICSFCHIASTYLFPERTWVQRVSATIYPTVTKYLFCSYSSYSKHTIPLEKETVPACSLGPPGDAKRPQSSLNLPDYFGLLTCKLKRQGTQLLLLHTNSVYKWWKGKLKSNSNSHLENERVGSIF